MEEKPLTVSFPTPPGWLRYPSADPDPSRDKANCHEQVSVPLAKGFQERFNMRAISRKAFLAWIDNIILSNREPYIDKEPPLDQALLMEVAYDPPRGITRKDHWQMKRFATASVRSCTFPSQKTMDNCMEDELHIYETLRPRGWGLDFTKERIQLPFGSGWMITRTILAPGQSTRRIEVKLIIAVDLSQVSFVLRSNSLAPVAPDIPAFAVDLARTLDVAA